MHESKETIVIVWEFRAGSSCHTSSLPRDHHAELLYAGGVALSRYEEKSSICHMCLFLKRFWSSVAPLAASKDETLADP